MKETILHKVAELFQKYGIRSVSMDDIAQHLGISKKTIYQFYEDKNDLVITITVNIVGAKLQEYKQVSDTATNAIEDLYITAKLIRKHFTELNPAFMYDLKKYHPEAWDLFAKHEKEVVQSAVVKNLERAKKEGYFRSEINTSVIAKIRFEQIQLTFDEQLFPKEEFDLSEVQVQLFDFFVHGLLTPNGLELFKNYQNQNDG